MGLFSQITHLLTRLISQPYTWPALDITLPGGRYLHLVGSIHMGTPNMAPLPPRLLSRLDKADALIVEADITTSASPFTEPVIPLAPLSERLSESQWQTLSGLAENLHLSLASLDNLPLWQVALMLQAFQARQLGLSPDYGIDVQLLEAAHEVNLPVRELEGATSQLSLLEQLPDDGRELLADTLTHWHTNARLLQLMMSWWLDNPPSAKDLVLPNTFSNDLYDVLMLSRNRQWYDYLHRLPPGRYVVAVGALHLYGEGNLPGLLKLPPDSAKMSYPQ
ncbi:hypothetical protein TUM12370_28140 [Salmonella enterica subsp. enterica serovar Choleraesuis]|nr:hypothetical protein TUM12370_28140 [Salmonella enterica subsp. enterica serovar Choleraesuis]